MKIILIEDVESLGQTGDIINVADGYGRNYLIPKKLAVVANTRNMKSLERDKRAGEGKARKEREMAASLAGEIEGREVIIGANVGEEGKLFGSVTTSDIAKGLEEMGIVVNRKQIVLDYVIKTVGEHPVTIKTSPGVTAAIVVKVVPQK